MTQKTLVERIAESLPEATRKNATITGATLFGTYGLGHVLFSLRQICERENYSLKSIVTAGAIFTVSSASVGALLAYVAHPRLNGIVKKYFR